MNRPQGVRRSSVEVRGRSAEDRRTRGALPHTPRREVAHLVEWNRSRNPRRHLARRPGQVAHAWRSRRRRERELRFDLGRWSAGGYTRWAMASKRAARASATDGRTMKVRRPDESSRSFPEAMDLNRKSWYSVGGAGRDFRLAEPRSNPGRGGHRDIASAWEPTGCAVFESGMSSSRFTTGRMQHGDLPHKGGRALGLAAPRLRLGPSGDDP